MEELPPDDELPPKEEPEQEAGLLPEARPGPARRHLRTAITLILVAALVVLAAIEGSGVIIRNDPRPQAPPATTAAPAARIAIVDANGALRSMDAAGGSIVSYPAPGVAFQFPAWSPDGRQLAAIAKGAAGAGVDVFAAAPDGSSGTAPTIVYQLPDHPAFYLYWAPDGKSLAFLTTEPNGIALRRALADASAPDTIVRNGAPMYWQWVDPTRLLVHSGGDTFDAFVGEVGLDGASSEPKVIRAGLFRAPGVSIGGSYLAYAAPGQGGSATVVVESRDGGNHHEVPVFGAVALDFNPGGDTLAFLAADAAGGPVSLPLGPLRAIDPASGAMRKLLDGPVVAFFWAPDGRTIAALRLSSPTDSNPAPRADAVGSLARAGGPAGGPAEGPAGEATQAASGVLLRITFVDVASGSIRTERVARLSNLFIFQVLPFFDQYALSHRFWSPDSTSIVLPIDDDQGITKITIFPSDGEDPRAIAPGTIGFWSP